MNLCQQLLSGDADSVSLELCPITCVFIISLSRALNQGARDPPGRLRGHIHIVLLLPFPTPDLSAWTASSELWPCFIFIFVPGAGLWFCSSVVYHGRPQGIVLLSVVLSLSYYSWFTANFLEHLWDLAFDLILFSILNSPKVMLALLWLQYICWWLSFAVLSCLAFMPLVPTSHPFGFPVWWRISDYGKSTFLNYFKRPRMWTVDSALNVYVTVCWVIFYLNFKSILYILVYYGSFPPLSSGEDYKKIALVSIWILSLKKKIVILYTHTHTHTRI